MQNSSTAKLHRILSILWLAICSYLSVTVVQAIWLLLFVGAVSAADLDDAVLQSLEEHKVPSASIAVVRNGTVVLSRGYGVAGLERRTKATPDTLFQAASISKPVTAMAVLRMAQDGRFGLDSPINDLLKSWKVPENSFTAAKKVTVRQLLSHTAGISVSGFPGYEAGAALPNLTQILKGVPPASTPPIVVEAEPGSAYRYSGGGYTILRLLLEETGGAGFTDLMRKMVLTPVGMTHSTFAQPLPPELAKDAASAVDSRERPVPGGWNVYPELAPDGLWTTPTDLAKFAIEVWRSLRGEPNRVLNRETARLMLTRQLGDYALGFEVHNEGKAFRFKHDGGNRGFRCRLLFYPDLGDGVAIMTNGGRGDEVIVDVMRALRAEYGWPQ